MAWIRRVRSASGATAVQIAESVNGRRRILAHVGSAHTEAELALLVERARQLLADPGQGQFEFGMGLEPLAPRTRLVGPPTDPTLLPLGGPSAGTRAVVAAPRVVSTDSRVLFEALTCVFTDLGFDAVGDAVFRDL